MIDIRSNVDITFHPSWWNKHTGIEFDEKFWFDAAYRVEADRQMRRTLYERFGDFGLGERDPAARPILFSDLLACGIKGEFIINSWNIDSALPQSFYEECAWGIEKVLRHYGLSCIGGDLGSASPWLWSAAAGGKITIPAPVRRIASAKVPFDLYATGSFGDANHAAFFKRL